MTGTNSAYTRELTEEHARAYAAGVAQAEAAQQAEYAANQLDKLAAARDQFNNIASQASAAKAVDVGYGPGVPPAPGYGSKDVIASDQARYAGATASAINNSERHIFARQGIFDDGRWVPNIFKVVNQDLWAGWGKSRGAEAVVTFPFVLAMSGAVFLPQAVNDIPNIPTLLATALTEIDYGNWGKALEAGGDALGAAGIAGELVEGVEALSSVESGFGGATGDTIDYSTADTHLGGKLYPRADLLKLEENLATRGIELRTGNAYLETGQAAGFDGVQRFMVLGDSPTEYQVAHEMAHLQHWEELGAEAYGDLSRLEKEQFVFDKLTSSELWETLTDEERMHAVDYIESLGGWR